MSNRTPDQRSVVYVIGVRAQRLWYVKIGTTRKLPHRISELQSGQFEDLHLLAHFPGSYGTERWLHERFADLRVRGEWFMVAGELRRWIADIRLLRNEGDVTREAALAAAGAKIRMPPRRRNTAWEPGDKRPAGLIYLEARRLAKKLA